MHWLPMHDLYRHILNLSLIHICSHLSATDGDLRWRYYRPADMGTHQYSLCRIVLLIVKYQKKSFTALFLIEIILWINVHQSKQGMQKYVFRICIHAAVMKQLLTNGLFFLQSTFLHLPVFFYCIHTKRYLEIIIGIFRKNRQQFLQWIHACLLYTSTGFMNRVSGLLRYAGMSKMNWLAVYAAVMIMAWQR